MYFTHPYSSWERPQNERHNRIFRRFVPKGISIDRYTAEQILEYADSMNYLPWNVFGYMIPEEMLKLFSINCIQLSRFKMLVSVQFAIAIYDNKNFDILINFKWK